MADHQLKYSVLPGKFAICRLAPSAEIPKWVAASEFFSITRSANELSIVCAQQLVPQEIQAEKDWVCLQLKGPFPFEMTGVLAAILNPLASAGFGIVAVSTFDTDYILIKADNLHPAEEALTWAGHERIG